MGDEPLSPVENRDIAVFPDLNARRDGCDVIDVDIDRDDPSSISRFALQGDHHLL